MKGRVGVYEIMRLDPTLRAMVGSRARAEEIHETALRQGMVDLRRYAGRLLLEGLTTVEEVTSVVSTDV